MTRKPPPHETRIRVYSRSFADEDVLKNEYQASNMRPTTPLAIHYAAHLRLFRIKAAGPARTTIATGPRPTRALSQAVEPRHRAR